MSYILFKYLDNYQISHGNNVSEIPSPLKNSTGNDFNDREMLCNHFAQKWIIDNQRISFGILC